MHSHQQDVFETSPPDQSSHVKAGTSHAVLVNGVATQTVGFSDRGLHYGDGLFETLALEAGQPLCWEQHMARLADGCQRLGLLPPSLALLREESLRVSAGLETGVLKLIVTRGSGGRGYRPPADAQPVRIVMAYPWPSYPAENSEVGVRVRICHTRLGRNPALAGIKHLNRLEQVLARNEWDDPSIAEGLMLDEAGQVLEGTMSNLFVVSRERLFTASLETAGVAGVMRRIIMESAPALGYRVTECTLSPEDLSTADELFLCNSLIGIWPVRELAGMPFKVGPVAGRLRRVLVEQGRIAGYTALENRCEG